MNNINSMQNHLPWPGKSMQGPHLTYVKDFIASADPKRRLKYIRNLEIVQSQARFRNRKLRVLKNVKHLMNLQHMLPSKHLKLDHFLSLKRNFCHVILNSVEHHRKFLQKTRSIKNLSIILFPSDLDSIMRARKDIKRIRINTLKLIYGPLLPTVQTEDIEKLMATYSRRPIFAFEVQTLTLQHVNFFNLHLVKLQELIVQNIDLTILNIMLLKARAFHGLEILDLGFLRVNDDLAGLAKNFSLFPKLNTLKLHLCLGDKESSLVWLQNFHLGTSLKNLSLVLENLSFPNPYISSEEDLIPFRNFMANFGRAANLEKLSLSLLLSGNFHILNQLTQYLPTNLIKIRKLDLKFGLYNEGDSGFEDERVVMTHLFNWAFTMPNLNQFLLQSKNRDFSDLSLLNIPVTLPWKTFDILVWPESSHDTMKHCDLEAILHILKAASQLENLCLSVESSYFDLDAFRLLSTNIGMMAKLKKLYLKLNCRKFSPYDYDIIQPELSRLPNLEVLSLVFISNGVRETEVWTYKLTRTFEKFQKLKSFHLSLYDVSRPIFSKSYASNNFVRKNSLQTTQMLTRII